MSNELTTIDARQLAEMAKADAALMPVTSGHHLSVRGGIMMYDGQPMGTNSLGCVVLDAVFENTYYTEPYDPDVPQSPRCYASARLQSELAPHPSMQNYPDYFKPQSATCGPCAWNAFKTAANGKGKACQNRVKLWLLPAAKFVDGQFEWFDKVEHYQRAEVATMRLPVTSVTNYKNYVNQLSATVHRPVQVVATGVTVVPDPKSQWKITFQHLANLPDEFAQILLARAATIKAAPFEGYQPPAEQ